MIRNNVFLAAFMALSGSVCFASDALDSTTVDALERFYQDFNGNNWHDNAGWLDPEVSPCDWNGVFCTPVDSEQKLSALVLPSNNLQGDLSSSDIFEHITSSIDLSANRISGNLPLIPHWLFYIDLSDNQLTAPLPEAPADDEESLGYLSLARNALAGELPESWQSLDISRLDLSGNQLSGSMATAVRAAGGNINLADNQFSGLVENVVFEWMQRRDTSNSGGVNLCWNDIQIEAPLIAAAVRERHVGGPDFEYCTARERQPLDQTVSGTWYEPGRDGEGMTVQLLDGGGSLMFYFTFDTTGRQHWLLGMGPDTSVTLHWPKSVNSTRGRFGEGMSTGIRTNGTGHDWRMDRLETDLFHFEQSYYDSSSCPDQLFPSYPCIGRAYSHRYDYQRLTQVAGTSCDNQHEMQHLSGTWFNPERNGEGFVLEVLADGRGLVYWFTYQPDDSSHQAWMIGDGHFQGQTLIIDDLLQPTGGQWGDAFESSQIVLESWGRLVMKFDDELAGHIQFESLKPEYGDGGYPVERLSRVRLAECEE